MGSLSYFRERQSFEALKKARVERWLMDKLEPSAIKDISGSVDGIELDKDYALLIKDRWIRVECKIRGKKHEEHAYRDILIETKSNLERNTLGWIAKSKAEMLAYLWEFQDGQVDGYIFNMPKLKAWWQQLSSLYANRRLAPNPPENPIYHTENYVVPIADIPKEIIIYP